MIKQERWIVAVTLAIIFAMIGIDLLNDSGEGVAIWHVLVEGSAGLAALFGLFYLLRGAFALQHRLAEEQQNSWALKRDAEQWRAESRKYVEGLSKVIDQQLDKWGLTVAEKEVAFLLLKGLGLKEIAEVRKTTEKTARVQSTAIYAKAKLSGRSELAAFFLEDLLVPASH